jgi:hypothetical protein
MKKWLIFLTLFASSFSVFASAYSFAWVSSYWYRTTSTYSGIGVPVKITGVSGTANTVTLRVWRDTEENDGVAVLRAVDHNGDALAVTPSITVSTTIPYEDSYPDSGNAGQDVVFTFTAPFEMDSAGTFFYFDVTTHSTGGGNIIYGTTYGGSQVVANQVCYGGNATADIPSCEPYNTESARIVVSLAPFLGFPLSGLTPYTANIRSVMDHYNDERFGCYDGIFVTHTGEKGMYDYGHTGGVSTYYPSGPYACSDQSSLFDYHKSDDEASFVLTGHYRTDTADETFISYDGHPGYDYPITDGTDVKAAAAGTVIHVSVPGSLGEIWINHENGYCTMYNHLSGASVEAEDTVTKGQKIGESGDTGANYDHLHFSVFLCEANDLYPTSPFNYVDPYGWAPIEGADVTVDPHTETDICLWDACP